MRLFGKLPNSLGFSFENVYVGSLAKAEEEKAKHIIEELYTYYMDNPDALPASPNSSLSRTVCDYIAGMTDRFAIKQFRRLFVPRGFEI